MPSDAEITHQQKLLTMYRELLTEYLRQEQRWEWIDVPPFLRNGIAAIRDNIVDVKGKLRSWKIAVEDDPDDEGPVNEIAGKVAQERTLLTIYRERLAILRQQQQRVAPEAVPPHLILEIRDLYRDIAQTKAILRGWNVPVDDQPGEDESGV